MLYTDIKIHIFLAHAISAMVLMDNQDSSYIYYIRPFENMYFIFQ